MPFTYDLTTDVGKVRLLIPDRVEAVAVFAEDDEVQAFLDLEGDVRRAAALALETIGSDLNLVLRYTKSPDGLMVDGVKAAAEARARAKALREQADVAAATDASAGGGSFDWAELVVDPFSARERLWAERLRDLP